MGKDLGEVTAYGYAVDKGYTGTEEEFAELMASYATVAQAAAASAQTATDQATAASSSALDASSSAAAAEEANRQAQAKIGAPLTAASADAMTDESRIYVYTGSETGYTYGNWYFWDGTQWAVGGIYNSAAIQTDTTLSVEGMPADAKIVGEDLSALFKETTSDNFVVSGILRVADGVTTSGDTRLTSAVAFSKHRAAAVESINGYSFTVYAWNGSTYIGGYKSESGTFNTNVGSTFLTSFSFLTWPDTYTFKICVKRSDGETITLAEASNVIFTGNAIGPDESLSMSGEAADAKVTGDKLGIITRNLNKYNAVDALDGVIFTNSETVNGVTYTYNDGVWTVHGTATADSYKQLLYYTPLPEALTPGKTYQINFASTNSNVRLWFRVHDADNVVIYSKASKGSFTFTLPHRSAKLDLFLRVLNGKSIPEESPAIVQQPTLLTRLTDEQILAVAEKQTEPIKETVNWIEQQAHAYRLQINPTQEMDIWKIVNGIPDQDDSAHVQGSNFIKCPKYLSFIGSTMERSGGENLIETIEPRETSVTRYGITYTYDNGTYSINGTPTQTTWVTLTNVEMSRELLAPGETYIFAIESDCNATIQIYYSINGDIDYTNYETIYDSQSIKLKSDFAGCLIRVYPKSLGTEYNGHATVKILKPAEYEEQAAAGDAYIYFYSLVDGEYTLRTDVLYQNNSTYNQLNRFSLAALWNRVIEVPENTFVQIGGEGAADLLVYGWDGEHTGAEISGNAYGTTPYNGGKIGVVIPGNAKVIFSKSFVTNEAYGYPRGRAGRDRIYKNSTDAWRGGIVLPDGYDWFLVLFAKMTPFAITDTLPAAIMARVDSGNLNSEIVCVCNADALQRPNNRALRKIMAAEAITRGIEWECKVTTRGFSDAYNFVQGVTYTSVPYVSRWITPGELGYHVSKHTFINAANDPDSAFYLEHSQVHGEDPNLSPGYGLVCSSFAELVSGWPYPMYTDHYLTHPDLVHQYTEDITPGAFLYNNGGHCVIADTVSDYDGISGYTIYEGVNPSTTRDTRLSTRGNPDFATDGNGAFSDYEYLQKYKYEVFHKDEVGYPDVYDIYAGAITGGSARPFRGDHSVMTNLTGVKINIKDAQATTLYLQRYTYTKGRALDHPVPYAVGSFSKTSADPIEITIDGSTVEVDTSQLTDGAIYGCYTNTDSTMEFFEYHEVAAGTYSKSENNFVFDTGGAAFWYVCFAAGTEQNSGKRMCVAVPYRSNGDYSAYRAVYNPENGLAAAAFVKGKLGAYVIPLTSE